MKTTVEISEALLAAARQEAEREGTTLRALLEDGLRRVLADRNKARGKPFRLRDASVGGKGLQPGVREGDWASMRDRVYEGHGS
jgi:hypothetical protein